MSFGRRSLTCHACVVLPFILFAFAARAQTGGLSRQKSATFQSELATLSKRAQPGTFGIAIVDIKSGVTWGVNAQRPFPMMSVFKAPVAAAVLDRVDAGSLDMKRQVTITRSEVDPGSAVPSIGDNFRGESMTFSVRQLLLASVSQSDNTAVDALIRMLGGPESVTRFLREKGIAGMHVDEDEAEIARVFSDLHGAAAPPAGETTAQENERLRAGYQAFLADSGNQTTPEAAALFLNKLWGNQLLTRSSTQYLLGLMYAQTIPRRLRAGLPSTVRLADKTGTAGGWGGRTAAYNDIGLLTWPDGHTVIVAGFLNNSQASQEDRDALFADLAREVAATLSGPGEESTGRK